MCAYMCTRTPVLRSASSSVRNKEKTLGNRRLKTWEVCFCLDNDELFLLLNPEELAFLDWQPCSLAQEGKKAHMHTCTVRKN